MTTYCILIEMYNYGVHYRTLIWRTPHRHIRDESLYASTGSFLLYSPPGGDENPRPGFDNWRSQLDRPRAGCPAGASEASQSPHRHILRRARTQVRAFFRMWHSPGDENPPTGVRQLATPVGQTASLRAAPAGASEASQSPSPPYFKKSSYASTGFFACGTRRGDENP
jgi:hypothetical protein